MKKFLIGLVIIAVLATGGYYAYTTFFSKEDTPKQETRKTTIKKQKNQKNLEKRSKPVIIAILATGWPSHQKLRAKQMFSCCIQQPMLKK